MKKSKINSYENDIPNVSTDGGIQKVRGARVQKKRKVGGIRKEVSRVFEEISRNTERIEAMGSRCEEIWNKILRLETARETLPAETERYIGALSEDFQSKLKGVSEMCGGLAESRVEIEEWIDGHKEIHRSINFRLNALESNN